MGTEPPLNAFGIFLSLLFLGVLLGSGIRWAQVLRQAPSGRDGVGTQTIGLPKWGLSTVDFILIVGALFITLMFFQNLAAAVYQWMTGESAVDGDGLTIRGAVGFSLAMQIPLLGVVLGARRFAPKTYGVPLSVTPLSWRQSAWLAADYLLRFFPLITLVGALWAVLLAQVVKLGWIDEPPLQIPVQLFTQGGDLLGLVGLALIAVILAPIAEEYFFRGVMYRFFADRMRFWAAAGLSGVIFSMIHWSLQSAAGLFFVGVLLAFIYQKHGNLRVPILFHAFFNALSLGLLFLSTKVPGVE